MRPQITIGGAAALLLLVVPSICIAAWFCRAYFGVFFTFTLPIWLGLWASAVILACLVDED